jgi:GDP-4-dehydro-6-deoxy-D-mannose reductase
VYGVVRDSALALEEDLPVAPANPYAASKAASEVVALQYQRTFGLDAVVVRSFTVVGPGQERNFALPSFAAQLAAISRGAAPPVLRVGNLDVERDFTDVRDVARAYSLLARCAEPPRVCNICSGVPTSLRQTLNTLIAESRLDVSVEVDPERLRPVDIVRQIGSNARLRAATGWMPRVTLEVSLADLYHDVAADAAVESDRV